MNSYSFYNNNNYENKNNIGKNLKNLSIQELDVLIANKTRNNNNSSNNNNNNLYYNSNNISQSFQINTACFYLIRSDKIYCIMQEIFLTCYQ